MTITPTETPRLANRAERAYYQALIEQLNRTTSSSPVSASPTTSRTTRSTSSSRSRAPASSASRSRAARSGTTAPAGARIRGGKTVQIEPVRQAREACYALRDYIEKRPPVDTQATAALGPRRRPAQHRTSRRLRPAGVPALEDHRPQRSSRSSYTSSTTSSSARSSTARCSPRTASTSSQRR